MTMHRPLFVEGDAGVGKTALAQSLASVLEAPLIRLQCYEGIDAAQALYDWDFPRQLLHLRAQLVIDPPESLALMDNNTQVVSIHRTITIYP